MARNGSGQYDLPTNSWNPATNGNAATTVDWQDLIDDVASALTQSVSADGQTPMTGSLNMNGNKIENLANAVANDDAATLGQVYSQGIEQSLASAATTDIGSVNSNFVLITGTTTITSLGTNYNGPRFVRFNGILTLTHNASTLLLPGGANITTAANDRAIFIPKGNPSDGWNCVVYQYASGQKITGDLAVTGNSTITGTLSVNGNATIGDSISADSHAINGAVDLNASTTTLIPALTVTQASVGRTAAFEGNANTLINGTDGNTIGQVLVSIPSGGTQAQNNIGPAVAFSGINSGRRKAMIAAVQTGSNANQMGLGFYTYSGTTTALDDVEFRGLFFHTGEFSVNRSSTAGAATGAGWLLLTTGGGSSYMTGTGSNTHMVFANNAGVTPTQVGSISSSGSATTYATSSDYRLKDALAPLVGSGEFIDALIPWQGKWKSTGEKFVGFIAHEFAEVSPSSVVGEKDAVDDEGRPVYQAMQASSAEVMANIVAELQSLRKRVAALES